MGLLAILDWYYKNNTDDSTEVEYRLISWGEIYPPILGNREHSIVARVILNEFPFKLFSISRPYSELPQKLCLTFRIPDETTEIYDSHFYPGEIAKEFASFLSIVTRRRIFVVGQTRYDGLPIEEAADFYPRSHSQEKQRLKEIQVDKFYGLLKNLQSMDRHFAQSFVIGMRMYHSAIEMMYTEPEFAYLFLVMGIEAVSSVIYKDFKLSDKGEEPTELDQYLNSSYPGWRELCDTSTPDSRKRVIEMLLTKAYLTRRKFRKFIIENIPEVFWEETEDDAKPDYLQGVIIPGSDGLGQEKIMPSDPTIREWEKVQRNRLKQTLDEIYTARSKLVHAGSPFPSSIVSGHFPRIPSEAVNEMLAGLSTNQTELTNLLPIPPLITFERLVSYCMVEFLSKYNTDKD